MYNTLKVDKIAIKNMRKIGYISINEIDKNFNVISGKNGAGKTTVLDALFFAIIGRTYFDRGISIESIIKKGQDKMEVEVTLASNGKEIKIKRKLTSKGNTDYTAIDSEMNQLTQKDLQDLIQQYSIDPLEFTRMKPKDQIDEIKQILGLDTKRIDMEIEDQFEKTKVARAIHTEKKKALSDLGTPEKVERVDIADLATELTQKTEYNEKKKALNDRINQGKDYIKDIDNQIAELTKKKGEAMEGLNDLGDKEKAEFGVDYHQLEPLKKKVAEADEQNKKATIREKYLSLETEADQAGTSLEKQKMILEEKREERADMIKNADLPIENMEIDERDGIKIGGVLFGQHSSAEQILLATKIIAHTNPGLKVIYIKDGSLLDEEKFDQLEKFAKDGDYQFFVEVVGEQVDTIIMSEGELQE